MYKMLLVLLVSFLSFATVFAQDKLTISGYVKDAKNGEALLGFDTPPLPPSLVYNLLSSKLISLNDCYYLACTR